MTATRRREQGDGGDAGPQQSHGQGRRQLKPRILRSGLHGGSQKGCGSCPSAPPHGGEEPGRPALCKAGVVKHTGISVQSVCTSTCMMGTGHAHLSICPSSTDRVPDSTCLALQLRKACAGCRCRIHGWNSAGRATSQCVL